MQWAAPSAPLTLGMAMQGMLTVDAIQRIERAAHQAGSGAQQFATYYVGQIVGAMQRSVPAASVVYDMIEEFIDAVEGLGGLLDG